MLDIYKIFSAIKKRYILISWELKYLKKNWHAKNLLKIVFSSLINKIGKISEVFFRILPFLFIRLEK